jgi:hypothetical protein
MSAEIREAQGWNQWPVRNGLEAFVVKDFLKLIFGRFSLKPVIAPEVYGP